MKIKEKMQKKLISNLKEFKNFYKKGREQANKDRNVKAVEIIDNKLRELEDLIEYYK